MTPEEKRKANEIFEELESDIVGWCYSIELWFCNDCAKHATPKGVAVGQAKQKPGTEKWHVQLVGQNNWNDEPWGEQYTFNTQREAWEWMQKLGARWLG